MRRWGLRNGARAIFHLLQFQTRQVSQDEAAETGGIEARGASRAQDPFPATTEESQGEFLAEAEVGRICDENSGISNHA